MSVLSLVVEMNRTEGGNVLTTIVQMVLTVLARRQKPDLVVKTVAHVSLLCQHLSNVLPHITSSSIDIFTVILFNLSVAGSGTF